MEVTLAAESWDWVPGARALGSRFRGHEGVVLQFGDSLTLARPNVAWALGNDFQTPEEARFLKWAHAGKASERNGWHLASVHPNGDSRYSYTAAVGCSARYLLTGEKRIAPLQTLLETYAPQIAFYTVGMSDVIRGTEPGSFAEAVSDALDRIVSAATIPIVATITPSRDQEDRVLALNAVLREAAAARGLPLLDLHAGVVALGGETLLDADGVHLTWEPPNEAPAPRSFARSGYLFRSWAIVRKAMEVRERVCGPLRSEEC